MTGEADDLRKLSRDLGKVPEASGKPLAAALHRTSIGVKDSWNQRLGEESVHGHMKWIGSTVNYDIESSFVGGAAAAVFGRGQSRLESEIGPDLARKQGSFAGWFEEGAAGVPATHAGAEAAAEWADDFERGVDAAIDDALGGVGL